MFIKRGSCEGVKICGGDSCNYTVANRHLKNKCKEHGPSKPFTKTGKCPIHFVYIWPSSKGIIVDGLECSPQMETLNIIIPSLLNTRYPVKCQRIFSE